MLQLAIATDIKFYLVAIILSWNWRNNYAPGAVDGGAERIVNDVTAISSDPYVVKLYQNRGVPSETDKAILSAQVRNIICWVIDDTGYSFIFRLVDLNEIAENRETYSEIFDQLFSPNPTSENSKTRYLYSNPFTERVFKVVQSSLGHRANNADSEVNYEFTESVFMCPLRNRMSGRLYPVYVSKEYNVSPFDELYMPARFIFWFTVRPNEYVLTLAEEPAITYDHIDSNFKVEEHYLRIRKYIELSESNEVDPLCKLVSGRPHDLNSQHDRLCASIAQSSFLKGRIMYPYRQPSACVEEKISFRTETYSRHENLYRERMVRCRSTSLEHEEDVDFYISRAYKSNYVFVYQRDAANGKMYLENMSTRVKVIDEINSFEFVEY